MIRRLTHKTSEAKLPMCEAVFIEAFDLLLKAEHANRERIGCPRLDALAQLATEPATFHDEVILVHLGRCAPCLQELIDLRFVTDSQKHRAAHRKSSGNGCRKARPLSPSL
jgi:hypothetical protein